MKQLLMDLKGEKHSNTILGGPKHSTSFNEQQLSKQKTEFIQTTEQMKLIDICRTFPPIDTEHAFFFNQYMKTSLGFIT